jgi:hypothetical protein
VRRTRKDIEQVQDRRAVVVRLRAEGRTFDEIAELTGFANSSGAWKCWQAAIKQRPDATVDEVRRQEKARLEDMDSRLADIICGPAPIKTTSIGRTQWDVRTCRCPTKARTDRDHDPDCPVEPVVDLGQVTAAIRVRLALGESLRRLVNADATPSASNVTIDQRSVSVMLLEINQDRALRGHPPLPAIPGFTA